MRTYGKKLLKNRMTNVVIQHQETRDAIIWDIDTVARVARCKIQGSNEYIISHYPQNWETTPTWMKPGMAVRIVHVGGDRGKVEIAGMGRSVPTPVSGNTLPPISAGADGLISGCYVTECPNTAAMKVQVHIGSYRLGGVVYILGPISCDDGANFACADGGIIDDVAYMCVISSNGSGLYRYDLVSAEVDGDCVVTTGTPSATPVKPTNPGTVALAYVLVGPGVTAIHDTDINHDYVTPAPSSLNIVIADDELVWADPSYTQVTVTVKDQYGNAISGTYTIKLSIESGNGIVWSADSGNSTSYVQQYLTGTNYTFIYARIKNDADPPGPPYDQSPMLKAYLYDYEFEAYGMIKLFDGNTGGYPTKGLYMAAGYTPWH
jgi:hypothetical protein